MGINGAPPPLHTYRGEFPILSRRNYLNTCSLGPLSLSARRAQDRFIALWDQKGARAWYEDWMDELARLEALYARLIGAQPDEVAFHPSVSSALTTAASCLTHTERPEVLLTELDFPTLGHQFLARAALGARCEFIRSPDGITVPPQLIEERVSARTGLVATLHVYFTTGAIQDVKRLARAAHREGAMMLVDGYHAVGSIPVDVHDLGADIYVGGSLKYLCGGPGAAFLYISREAQERLRPTTTGWFSQRRQFDFLPDELEYAEGSQRYRTGTPPTGSVYAAAAGVELILEVGMSRIRAHQKALTQRMTDGARQRGLDLVSPLTAEERGGLVMLKLAQPESMVQRLLQRGIVTDSRPGKLRLSAHFYNTEEECDQVLDAIAEELG